MSDISVQFKNPRFISLYEYKFFPKNKKHRNKKKINVYDISLIYIPHTHTPTPGLRP